MCHKRTLQQADRIRWIFRLHPFCCNQLSVRFASYFLPPGHETRLPPTPLCQCEPLSSFLQSV